MSITTTDTIDTTEATEPIVLNPAEVEAFKAFQAEKEKRRVQEIINFRRNAHTWGMRATREGASTAEINAILAQLGVELLDKDRGRSAFGRYKATMHVQIDLSSYTTRVEAESRLRNRMDRNGDFGRVESGAIMDHAPEPDSFEWYDQSSSTWVSGDAYWAEPETVEVTVPETIEELRAIARREALALRRKYRWCTGGMDDAFIAMELGGVPAALTKYIDVPATGAVKIAVEVYEDDDEATVSAKLGEVLKTHQGGSGHFGGTWTGLTFGEPAAAAATASKAVGDEDPDDLF